MNKKILKHNSLILFPSKYSLIQKTLPCYPPQPNAFPNALAFPKALAFHNSLACLVGSPSAPAKAGRRLRPTYLINLKTLCCMCVCLQT